MRILCKTAMVQADSMYKHLGELLIQEAKSGADAHSRQSSYEKLKDQEKISKRQNIGLKIVPQIHKKDEWPGERRHLFLGWRQQNKNMRHEQREDRKYAHFTSHFLQK